MPAKFGPAGNSESFSANFKSTIQAPGYLEKMGLDHYEYQCGRGVRVSDKLAHGVLYAVLAISMMAGVRRDARMRVRTYLYVCALATSYGALMEILQRYCTLTRSGEMADLYADAIGALIGIILFGIFEVTRSRYLDRSNHE